VALLEAEGEAIHLTYFKLTDNVLQGLVESLQPIEDIVNNDLGVDASAYGEP
jgi:hypothetical protein